MAHYKILVVGCPRSGTRFMRTLLRGQKIDVGHEALKDDGAVSCFYAVEDYHYPGKHYRNDETKQYRSLNTFDHVWHQVRDPRCVIPSMVKGLQPAFWHWQEKHTWIPGDAQPPELRAMLFWLHWNRMIDAIQQAYYRYRIEAIDSEWPKMRSLLGLPEIPLPVIPRNIGTSKAPPMTWEQMKAFDEKTFSEVRELASVYGYED